MTQTSSPAARRMQITAVVVVSEYTMKLYVAYSATSEPRLSLSVPTGAGAAYQEARDQGRADAIRHIRRHIAEIQALYPAAAVTVTGLPTA